MTGEVATSRLELQWRVRSGGGGRVERRYLDFIVDGHSLMALFQLVDYVTDVGCWTPDHERTSIERLITGPERLPIYVCAECGDLACGAITAFVESTSDGVVWREFLLENGLDVRTPYSQIGPFKFDTTSYQSLLRERLAALPAER